MVRPVSGIAMGLISDGEKYAVLSDILCDEDHLGDMDFKVTGTENGITACQMDIKIKGLSYEILVNALKQSREGRMHILVKCSRLCLREQLKPNAPKIMTLTVKGIHWPIIGPGGKNIQGIQADTGTTVTIEEIEERGHIEISGKDYDMMNKALEMIRAIAFDLKLVKLMKELYAAFRRMVLLLSCPKVQGLLHISEIDWTLSKMLKTF